MQVLSWLLLVCGFCFNPLNSPILAILLLSPSYSWEAGTGKDKVTCPRSQRQAEGRCGHKPRFATHPFIGAHPSSCFCGHCHQTKDCSQLVFPAQYWHRVWSSKFLYLNEFLSTLSLLFQKRKALLSILDAWASQVAHLPMQKTHEMGVRSLGWEDPLEEEMATHSSVLAWKVPWTEESGWLQSMGSKDLDTAELAHISLYISTECMLSHVRLFATSWTVVCQASLPMGFFQARIMEWVAISSSRGSSWPRDWTHVSCVFCIGRWILYHWATWETPSIINYMYWKCTIWKKKKVYDLTHFDLYTYPWDVYALQSRWWTHILLPQWVLLLFFHFSLMHLLPSFPRPSLLCFLSLHLSLHLLKFYESSQYILFPPQPPPRFISVPLFWDSSVLLSVSILSFCYRVVFHCIDTPQCVHPPLMDIWVVLDIW